MRAVAMANDFKALPRVWREFGRVEEMVFDFIVFARGDNYL